MSERLRAIDRQTGETHYHGQGEYEDYEIALGKSIEKFFLKRLFVFRENGFVCELSYVNRHNSDIALLHEGDVALRFFIKDIPAAPQPIIRESYGVDPAIGLFYPRAFSLTSKSQSFDSILAI